MSTPDIKNLGTGLTKSKPDSRHFRFGSLYTLPKLSEIPEEFEVGIPRFIKDQGATDYCTAFASAAVSEDQEGVDLDPYYQFYLGKIIQGEPESWGCDLISMAKSLTKHGSLERKLSPVSLETPRETILDPKTWDKVDLEGVECHKKASFMIVTGPYDIFDNIRATLWKSKVLGLNQSIFTGVVWATEWGESPDGIIDVGHLGQSGHAFKIYGTSIKKGKVMLKAQLSNGPKFGDEGMFYFSREVVNEQFQYEAIIFTDVNRKVIEYSIAKEVKLDDPASPLKLPLIVRIINWIKKLMKIK